MFNICDFKSADFILTEFTAVVFSNYNFKKGVFDETILKNADLSAFFSSHTNPKTNQLSKAKFSLEGLAYFSIIWYCCKIIAQ